MFTHWSVATHLLRRLNRSGQHIKDALFVPHPGSHPSTSLNRRSERSNMTTAAAAEAGRRHSLFCNWLRAIRFYGNRWTHWCRSAEKGVAVAGSLKAPLRQRERERKRSKPSLKWFPPLPYCCDFIVQGAATYTNDIFITWLIFNKGTLTYLATNM